MGFRVSSKWIRNESDEQAIKDGMWFDTSEGLSVIEFIERFCTHVTGEYDKQPFKLMDYQRDFIMRLYGWRRARRTSNGKERSVRRFKKAYLEVPKKNGKSELVAGLGQYHLVGECEPTAEVVCVACTLDQARLVFEDAVKMRNNNESLRNVTAVEKSRRRIVYPAGGGVFRALSSEHDSNDGIRPSCVIFDELHRQKSPSQWNVLSQAGISRAQSLLIAITTAGNDKLSVCGQQHDYAEKINASKIVDTSYLGVIYSADINDDLEDPRVWRKANPAMGIILDESEFACELRQAKQKPSEWLNFLRLRLNIWTQSVAGFISDEEWSSLANPAITLESLKGKRCWLGVDLSKNTDLTAVVILADDGRIYSKFWIPEETVKYRDEKQSGAFGFWAKEGHVEVCSGETINYDDIHDWILNLRDHHGLDIVGIGSDPWQAIWFMTILQDRDGFDVTQIHQGRTAQTLPIKMLETLCKTKEVEHSDNPVMNWCMSNVDVDHKGDFLRFVKPSYEDRTEKGKNIDGACALVSAIAVRQASLATDNESPYESRGILYL